MKSPHNSYKNVYQFTAGSAFGDAVTNSTLFIQELLNQANIPNQIFTGHLAPELHGKIEPHFRLKPKKDDLLLIHHAIGFGLCDWLLKLPCEKIIIYHNITPAEFFPEDHPVRDDIRLGHQQLRDYVTAGVRKAISISDYNKIDLLEAGFLEENIITLPLLLDFDAIPQKPYNKELVEFEKKLATVFFVGRISPHKCQHQLLEVAHYLRQYMATPFQMIIAGNYHEEDSYFQSLQAKHKELKLQDWVQFTGKIPEEDLFAWYRVADCFLCLSEHEGFGVPVAEAMQFGVPVIGYNAANIPFLLDNAGLIVNEKNLPAIAALVKDVLENPELRDKVIKAQFDKVNEIDHSHLFQGLVDFV